MFRTSTVMLDPGVSVEQWSLPWQYQPADQAELPSQLREVSFLPTVNLGGDAQPTIRLLPIHGPLDLVTNYLVDPVGWNEELPVAVLRYAQGRVLLQVARDLREGPVCLVLTPVDAVGYSGDSISRVHTRGCPRCALATVDDAHLLFLLLRMHAGVHQPHHNAVGHCHRPF